jgi:hypothetical protein
MVTMGVLNVTRGDKELYFEDTTKAERDKLAEEMITLQKKGFALFLIQGEESRQIKGYDAETHQWILLSEPKAPPKKGKRERVSAKDTNATAVGAQAGG